MAHTVEDLVSLLQGLPQETIEDLHRLLSRFRKGTGLDFDAWAIDTARRRGFDRLSEADGDLGMADLDHHSALLKSQE